MDTINIRNDRRNTENIEQRREDCSMMRSILGMRKTRERDREMKFYVLLSLSEEKYSILQMHYIHMKMKRSVNKSILRNVTKEKHQKPAADHTRVKYITT